MDEGIRTPAKTSARPLWFLGPGGIPAKANGKRVPATATHMAHEGDAEWTPIGPRDEEPGPAQP